jgi:xanthine/uracil/vitamin C permease (AzgA family)
MIPLTFSIANGIALGFISYVVLKIASGKVALYICRSLVPNFSIFIKIYFSLIR